MRIPVAVVLSITMLVGGGAPAHATEIDPDGAESVVLRARHEGLDGFCTEPSTPLSPRARAMCPMAAQIPQCDAFVAACNDKPVDPDKLPKWHLGSLAAFLGSLASGIVWTFVALVVALIAFFVASAMRRARRDVDSASAPAPKTAVITPDPVAEALDTTSDAELLLQRASEHAQRGELDRAALLYLSAALRALDRRGAIRLARHRTNGEYVRACKDERATPQLRAIVRAVDRVQFGHLAATPEGIADVAARATWIVRAVAVASVLLLLGGCKIPDRGAIPKSTDPGGDDLFMAVLERQGMDVARIGGPLASLPIPAKGEKTPLLVVDASRTALEDETREHLARWVRAGGRLILAGNVKEWPEDFEAKPKESGTPKVTFHFPDPDAEEGDDEPREDGPGARTVSTVVAEPRGLEWSDSFTLATTEDKVGYAAARAFDGGIVVGLAGDDLLTNAGMALGPNAKAVDMLIARYGNGRKIRVATAQDGISPPGNPLSALLHAGLGLSLVHATFATILLMLAFGIRQARARGEPPPARRAFSEHVTATGTLYARAGLAPHALFAYARFVDGRLRARMPRSMTDPVAFLALRSGADAVHCARVWALATGARSADRPRGDELTTLRDLRALYAATLKTG